MSLTKGNDEKENVISDNKHLSQGLGFDKPGLMTLPAFKINVLGFFFFCSWGKPWTWLWLKICSSVIPSCSSHKQRYFIFITTRKGYSIFLSSHSKSVIVRETDLMYLTTNTHTHTSTYSRRGRLHAQYVYILNFFTYECLFSFTRDVIAFIHVPEKILRTQCFGVNGTLRSVCVKVLCFSTHISSHYGGHCAQ